LSIGRVGGAWVVSSETCAFDLLGAEYIREMDRGEVVVIDVGGCHSFKPFPAERPAGCFFEHVYFARPDSLVFGESVQAVRKRLGEALYKEHPLDVDVVVPVPDSGVYAALGYGRSCAGGASRWSTIRSYAVRRRRRSSSCAVTLAPARSTC
jgi:amidophosphoribosyltransferase